MDVVSPRQRGGVDLDYGPQHHQVPVRPRFRDAVDQREIHAFVDHAEESEPRVRNTPLVIWLNDESARLGEVLHINAAGKGMDIGMRVALRFVKRLPASEYDVRVA